MGMGYAASNMMAFTYETVKELCPEEVAAIEAVPNFENWGWLAEGLQWEVEVEGKTFNPYLPLVERLIQSFAKATETDGKGLRLELNYYDSDTGDLYDEVHDKDGCIFGVEGVFQLTPAGEKFKSKLCHVSYVVLG